MKIILASASPRRAELLKTAGVRFSIDPSGIDEHHNGSLAPGELVEELSRQKGEDVASRHKDAMIIASDTIVWYNHRALGKPVGAEDATRMLSMLSGTSHTVYSGVWVSLRDENGRASHTFSFHSRTNVNFSPLSDEEIKYYVKSGSPMDKAGSYGIQDDFGSFFVESIEGDYNTVVGFPLQQFYRRLREELPDIHQSIFFPEPS